VTGQLLDGTPFGGADCIRLVPRGSGPATCDVASTESGNWVHVSPLDETLDGGGFGKFRRTYPGTTLVTLSPEPVANGGAFLGWKVDGGPLQPASPISGSDLSLLLEGEHDVVAVYESSVECGLGAELAFVVPLLALARRRLRRPRA